MMRPALLLLDEPCSHLDPQASAAILQDVQELAAQGITVVLSTHRPEEIALAQRVLRLDHGQLQTSCAFHPHTPQCLGAIHPRDLACSRDFVCHSSV